MNTTETKVKLVKGNSVIYAMLRKGEFKRFTKDGETVCDGEFQKIGGAPETRHGDYAAMKRLFHEFVGAKCVDGYTVEGSAAAALGRIGGKSTSPAKRAASRANGAKGGRPCTEFHKGKVFASEGGFRVCGGVWAGGPILKQSPWFATREEAEREAAAMLKRRAERDALDRLAGLRPEGL